MTTTTRTEVRAAPLGAFVLGGAVSVALGVYASVHDPSERAPFELFFSGSQQLKVWTTTVAVLLAIVQLVTALRMYERISWPAVPPDWFGQLHRLSGTLAFLFTIPVGYTCLWSFGWNGGAGDTRTLLHSLFGCLFYGALAAKVFVIRSKPGPRWVLPLLGGLVFTLLVALFATSAVWFWSDRGFPSF